MGNICCAQKNDNNNNSDDNSGARLSTNDEILSWADTVDPASDRADPTDTHVALGSISSVSSKNETIDFEAGYIERQKANGYCATKFNFYDGLKGDMNILEKITDDDVLDYIKTKDTSNISVIDLWFAKSITTKCIIGIGETCPNLKTLNLAYCGLSSLPENFGSLFSNLEELNLEYNNLTTLPRSISNLAGECTEFYPEYNPLQEPPLAIATKGLEAIKDYFSELANGTKTKSNAVKVLLMGNGKVGKTSLLRALQNTSHPLTKEDERTIHVNHTKIVMPVEEIEYEKDWRGQYLLPGGYSGEYLTLTVYDCGGQEEYAVAQTPFITPSALVLLMVNADEQDDNTVIRFLDLIQYRAPGAVVQLIITKCDLVDNPEGRKEWLLDIVTEWENLHQNKNSAQNNEASYKNDETPRFLRVQKDVMLCSVKEDLEYNDDDEAYFQKVTEFLDFIRNVVLTQEPTPLFPVIGQSIPESWMHFQRLLDIIPDYSFSTADDEQKMFDVVYGKEIIMKRSDGENGRPYMTKEEITNLYTKFCNFKKDKKNHHIIDKINIGAVLEFMEAQGTIYSQGDLVFLDPPFIGGLMAGLMDHTLTQKQVKTDKFNEEIVRYCQMHDGSENAHGDLKVHLLAFVKNGEIKGKHVLPFLWRNVEKKLHEKDHVAIVQMLINTDIIHLSEPNDNGADTVAAILSQTPVVIYRRPSIAPDIPEKEWPFKSPSVWNEFEVRIQVVGGCPLTLPPHLTVKVHPEGSCKWVYLNGIIVGNKKKGRKIKVDLVKDLEKQGRKNWTISIIIRAKSDEITQDDLALIDKLLDSIKLHQRERLPGLLYNVLVTCPAEDCGKFGIRWNPKEHKVDTEYTCMICGEEELELAGIPCFEASPTDDVDDSTQEEASPKDHDDFDKLLDSQDWNGLATFINRNAHILTTAQMMSICSKGPPRAVLECIYQAEALFFDERNKGGQYLLHRLCSYGAPWGAIEYAISSNKNALSREDNNKRMPIDYVLRFPWTFHQDQQAKVLKNLKREVAPNTINGLTNLLNKEGFAKWSYFQPPNVTRSCRIVVAIDIAGFKAINDTYGHEVGNEALKYYAREIEEKYENVKHLYSEHNKEVDVYRTGGDEFCAVFRVDDVDEDCVEKVCVDIYNQILVKQVANIVYEKDKVSSFLRLGCSYSPEIKNDEELKAMLDYSDKLEIEVRDKLKSNLNVTREGKGVSLAVIRNHTNCSNISILKFFDPNNMDTEKKESDEIPNSNAS